MNFKKCKQTFENYSKGKMSKEDFDKWSKENCEKCRLYIKDHCIFGKKHI